MLWPLPHRTAKIASPMVPFSGQRARRPSVFMWPISGSMALRRRRSAIILGVRPAAGAADQHAGFVDTMAAIATVDDNKVGALVGQDFHLFERRTQGMAVIGIAWKAAHADHKAFVQGRRQTDLAAKLMSRTRALPLEMQSTSGSCRA